MNETLTITIDAMTGNFDRSINSVVERLGGTSAVAVVGAAAAASAAIAAFATKAVTSFAALESGMGEVFTLMPGMSAEAMDAMIEDVQAFADATGNMTDKVVPALYNSISAGVPADNVFAFLETANALAVGGVTDLNTAVDGLTSVVNAYGAEILSAEEASDIMFSAVKQGKTTVDELAGTLGRVSPIAAAMGVEFDELNAFIATLTSQGIGTAEAVTGLKAAMSAIIAPTTEAQAAIDAMSTQMLENGTASAEASAQYMAMRDEALELSVSMQALADAGMEESEAYAALEAQAGMLEGQMADLRGGVLDNIMASEGLNGVFQAMSEYTGGNIDQMTSFFGSVEALNTVMAVTSENGAQKFLDAMAEMDNSAGATQTAFETMDQTLGMTWNKVTARVQTFTQDVGAALAPIVNVALQNLLAAMDNAEATMNNVLTAISGFFTSFVESTDVDITGLTSSIGPMFEAMADLVGAVFQRLADYWTRDLKPTWDAIEPAVSTALALLVNTIEAAFAIITGVLTTVALLVDRDFVGAWDSMRGLVIDIVNRLKESVMLVIDALVDAFGDSWNRLADALEATVARIRDGIASAFIEAARATVSAFDTVAEQMAGIFGMVTNVIRDAVNEALGFINALIDAWNGISFSIPEIELPTVTIPNPFGQDRTIGGGSFGGQTFNVPRLPTIPLLAAGGIVNAATLAMIGEGGPEAVIPLDRLSTMLNGGDQTIIIELDGQRIAQSTVRNAPGILRAMGV